jgi:hypothetical protein
MYRRVRVRGVLLFSLAFCSFNLSHSQTTQSTLTSLSTAFSQGKAVNSVTLNANATWTLGSDNQAGNAILTASADGSFNLQLQLAQSSRTESQTSFASGQRCTWAGTDGVAQSVAGHNCLGSMAWFLPSVALLGDQQPASVITSLPAASSVSTSLVDIRQQRTPPSAISADQAGLLTHISSSDLYLDPATYLPTAFAYAAHPDDNAASDIPVQILFTNYQAVNGIMIPFHIQRYINGQLNLDLTVTQASAN